MAHNLQATYVTVWTPLFSVLVYASQGRHCFPRPPLLHTTHDLYEGACCATTRFRQILVSKLLCCSQWPIDPLAVNFSMHGCVPTAAAGTYGSRFTTYSQLAHSKQLHKPAGAAAAVAPAGGAPTMAPASQHIAPHAGKRSQPEERGEQVVELRRKLSGSPTVVQYPPRGLATTKRKVGAYSRSPKPLTWRSCVVLQ